MAHLEFNGRTYPINHSFEIKGDWIYIDGKKSVSVHNDCIDWSDNDILKNIN